MRICVVFIFLSSSLSAIACPEAAQKIISTSNVLVFAISENWQASRAKVKTFSREKSSQVWSEMKQLEDDQAFIGENGMAWGHAYRDFCLGLNPSCLKQEGDHRSPAGVFSVAKAFGFGKRPIDEKNGNYFQTLQPLDNSEGAAKGPTFQMEGKMMVPSDWNCSDDVNNPELYSKFFHRLKNDPRVTSDSGEQLGANPLYPLALDVDTQTEARAKSGSCIFIHKLDEDLLNQMDAEINKICTDSKTLSKCAQTIELKLKYHAAGRLATFGCTAIHLKPLAALVDFILSYKSRQLKTAFVSLPKEVLRKKEWQSCFPGIESLILN